MKDGKKTDASVAISTAFHDRNKEKGLNSPSSTNQTRNLIMKKHYIEVATTSDVKVSWENCNESNRIYLNTKSADTGNSLFSIGVDTQNYNSNNNQPWSYQVAINECKRVGSPYKFVRYENGGIMLCINSLSNGWFPYRGSDCSGQWV